MFLFRFCAWVVKIVIMRMLFFFVEEILKQAMANASLRERMSHKVENGMVLYIA